MVFQNPFASLNPRWSVQEILLEAFVGAGLKADLQKAQESLEAVGLEAKHLHYYPFELSGGRPKGRHCKGDPHPPAGGGDGRAHFGVRQEPTKGRACLALRVAREIAIKFRVYQPRFRCH